MPKNTLPSTLPNSQSLPDLERDRALSSAAHLQRIFPDAVLVCGTASAIYAEHRYLQDADPVLTNLRERFDDVPAQLESVAGRATARLQRPVLILGSLKAESACDPSATPHARFLTLF